MTAIGKLSCLVIDVTDLDRAVAFWSAVLGVEPGEQDRNCHLFGRQTDGVRVVLQEVPEPKIGKARVHLDLACDDLDAAAQRVQDLGGRLWKSSTIRVTL